MRKHVAAMRGYGAAVVHLSPHAFGEAEVGVDNAGGDRRHGRRARRAWAIGGSRSWPARRRCTSARQRLDGYRRGLGGGRASRSTSAWSSAPAFNREGGALAVDDAARRGRAVHRGLLRPTTCWRSGRCSAWPSSASRSRGEVSVAGFDDIPTAAIAAPRLSTVRLPLHEIGRRGFAFAERQLAGARPRREVLPTELVMRESTAPPPAEALPGPGRSARGRGGRLMAGALAGRVVLVTGSSRGIGAEVAVKAAAEGATVAVHYRRSARRRPTRTLARVRARRRGRRGVRAPTSPTAPRPSGSSSAVIERFGRIDGLVNNAGRTQVGPFLEIEPARLGRGHRAPT